MTTSLHSIAFVTRRCSRGLAVGFSSLIAVFALSGSLLAQDVPPPDGGPGSADATNGNGRMRRGNFSPEAAMAAAKEQFGVTDDAEWSLISARIMAVMDLRRSTGAMGGGMLRIGGAGGRFSGKRGRARCQSRA